MARKDSTDVVAMPYPTVAVEELGGDPIRPRDGTRKHEPDPAGAMVGHCLHPAAAQETSWVTAPRYSSGTSTTAAPPAGAACRRSPGVTAAGRPTVRLVALPAHGLDQHRERETPRPRTSQGGVRPLGGQDLQRHVAGQLTVEPVPDQPGGDLGALLPAAIGELLMPIVIEIAGSCHADQRQRAGVVRVGQGLADHDVEMPAIATMSPGPGGVGRGRAPGPRSAAARDLDPLHDSSRSPGDLLAAGRGRRGCGTARSARGSSRRRGS